MTGWIDSITFWTVFASISAFLALVLVAFPLIRARAKGTRVLLSVPESFNLYHDLGNLNLALHLGIHNRGGTTVQIAKIDCYVELLDSGKSPADRKRWFVPARGYWYGSDLPAGPNIPEIMFGTLKLPAGEDWFAQMHCYDFFRGVGLDAVQRLRLDVMQELAAAYDIRESSDTRKAEISPETTERAINLFHEHMQGFDKGTYRLFLAVIDSNGRLCALSVSQFVLHEYNIEVIKSITEEFKYGLGITWYAPMSQAKVAYPTLMGIPETQALRAEYLAHRRV